MVNESLLKYVRKMRAQGISDENIKKALLDQGWTESDILGAAWHDSNEAKEERVPKKKRKHASLFVMVILLSAAWIAALLYLRIWDPPWNPMPPVPEDFINMLPF